jgi:hypothetical protein
VTSVVAAILSLTLLVSPAAAQTTADPGHIDTVAPRSVIELPFSFQSGALTLPGTLTMPTNYSGAPPVALIVAGSGPTDRNGNSAGPLRAQNNSSPGNWRLPASHLFATTSEPSATIFRKSTSPRRRSMTSSPM